MNVTVLAHTPDPEGTVAMAARLCYSRDGIGRLAQRVSRGDTASFIRKVVSLGHHSVLEHAVFTLGIEGISRAASHQLVRHRLASYSQKSQRYVVEEEPFTYVIPPSLRDREDLAAPYREAMASLHALYRRFLQAGVPAEDARYVFPNAATTQLLVTMNARELRHFFALRLCLRAQWEIREMAELMLERLREKAPLLFRGVGPACTDGPCPEGEMTCGHLVEVRSRYRLPAGEGETHGEEPRG